MTIDEAIERAEDVAKTCEDAGCAEFHAQIAEWLRQARDAGERNAKLHDLIEALLQCAGETKRDKGCDACPMWDGNDTDAIHERRWCLLRPTLREFGFEVSEWRVGDDGRLHQVKEVDE